MLGEALAPSPQLMGAQTTQQNSAFNDAMSLANYNKQTLGQSLAMPGELRTLGYSPSNADSIAASFGKPIVAGQNGFPSLPSAGGGLGNTAKTAIGAGLSFGVPLATNALKGLGAAAPAAASAAAPSMASIASGIDAAAVPDIGAATGVGAAGAADAGAAAADAGAAAGAGAGGAGIMGTLGALATNPLTWAAAGALGAGLLWKQSQVHPTADTWVQGEQNPFDKTWANISDQINQGSLTPQEGKQMQQQNAQQYLTALQQFSQKGSKEAIVAKQALATFRQYYGDPAQYGISITLG